MDVDECHLGVVAQREAPSLDLGGNYLAVPAKSKKEVSVIIMMQTW